MFEPQYESKRFEITYTPETLISNVLPIHEGGVVVTKTEDLVGLVEAPLLKSMKTIFQKGIRSVQSSANPNGVWFHLDKTSMTEQNVEIALANGFTESQIRGSRITPTLFIEYPLSPQLTFGEVEKWSVQIADKFQNQKFVIEK